QRKRFSRPIAKTIKWIPGLLQLFQYFHRAIKCLANGIHPILVVCPDQICILRELFSKDRPTFGKRAASILVRVPLHEFNLAKKIFHSLRVIWKITPVYISWIPIDQDVAIVEDDGFDGR